MASIWPRRDWAGIAKIVDRSGRVVRVLGESGTDFNFSDVAFSSDGRLVATAEWSGSADRVRVWDWARGEVLLTIDAEGPFAAGGLRSHRSEGRVVRFGRTRGDVGRGQR